MPWTMKNNATWLLTRLGTGDWVLFIVTSLVIVGTMFFLAPLTPSPILVLSTLKELREPGAVWILDSGDGFVEATWIVGFVVTIIGGVPGRECTLIVLIAWVAGGIAEDVDAVDGVGIGIVIFCEPLDVWTIAGMPCAALVEVPPWLVLIAIRIVGLPMLTTRPWTSLLPVPTPPFPAICVFSNDDVGVRLGTVLEGIILMTCWPLAFSWPLYCNVTTAGLVVVDCTVTGEGTCLTLTMGFPVTVTGLLCVDCTCK